MKTAQELRSLLGAVETAYGATLLIRELTEDLIARREADEAKAVSAEAAALRARVFAECHVVTYGAEAPGATTLTHRPTGLSAAAPTRDAALESLIGMLRDLRAL